MSNILQITGGFTETELHLGRVAYEAYYSLQETGEFKPWDDLLEFDKVRWVSAGTAIASFGDKVEDTVMIVDIIRAVPSDLRAQRAALRAVYGQPGASVAELTASDLLYLNLRVN